MNGKTRRLWSALFSVTVLPAIAASPALIIVEDRGGVSALPYYRALKLPSDSTAQRLPAPLSAIPAVPRARFSETSALPVRSARLSPGDVKSRTIQAPGLTPIFLVGDDSRSRDWLRRRSADLRELHAVGFVVNVATPEALHSLRQLAPGLTLSPSSGDDLAQRLGLEHYPALITDSAIEQ